MGSGIDRENSKERKRGWRGESLRIGVRFTVKVVEHGDLEDVADASLTLASYECEAVGGQLGVREDWF